jgi:hypothetical protein
MVTATATTTAATTAATAASATTTTAATGTLFGFVDTQRTPVEVGTVHRRHGAFGFRTRAHGHEPEAARLSRHAIRDEVDIDDLTVRGESLAQRVLSGVEGQVSYVQTISHDAFSILAPKVVRFPLSLTRRDFVAKVDEAASSARNVARLEPCEAQPYLLAVVGHSILGTWSKRRPRSCGAAHWKKQEPFRRADRTRAGVVADEATATLVKSHPSAVRLPGQGWATSVAAKT